MKLLFILLSVCSFLPDHGIFTDTDGVSVFVMENESVTLNSGVELNKQDRIRWYYNGIRVAQITGDQSKICTDVQCNSGTERFRDRLKLDHQTGSLTITNIRNTDSGEYQLRIISDSSSDKIFNINVHDVHVAERDEIEKKEGESVTLDPGEIKMNDVMTWYFNGIRIAQISGDLSKIYSDVPRNDGEERFRDRLKLDHQTGSLTITNTRNTDSGLYRVWTKTKSKSSSSSRHHRSINKNVKSFNVTVIVPDSGLLPGAVAGFFVAIVLFVCAVGVIYYRRYRNGLRQGSQQDHFAVTLFPLT